MNRGLRSGLRGEAKTMPWDTEVRTSGSLTFGTAWAAMTTAHDLQVPASADDRLLVTVSAFHGFSSIQRFLDMVTIVKGQAVSYVGRGAGGSTYEGVAAWACKSVSTSVAPCAGGSIPYTVAEKDIESGQVTLRLFGRANSGAPALTATADFPLILNVVNLDG